MRDIVVFVSLSPRTSFVSKLWCGCAGGFGMRAPAGWSVRDGLVAQLVRARA